MSSSPEGSRDTNLAKRPKSAHGQDPRQASARTSCESPRTLSEPSGRRGTTKRRIQLSPQGTAPYMGGSRTRAITTGSILATYMGEGTTLLPWTQRPRGDRCEEARRRHRSGQAEDERQTQGGKGTYHKKASNWKNKFVKKTNS